MARNGCSSLSVRQVADWALSGMSDAEFRAAVLEVLSRAQAEMAITKASANAELMRQNANPIQVGGVSYNSKRHAMRSLQIRRDQLEKLLSSNNPLNN